MLTELIERKLQNVLAKWETHVGQNPRISLQSQGRTLWLVESSIGGRFYLKEFNQWRNLPLEDEAHVLRHLARNNIRVAEFILTDTGQISVGDDEE